MFRIAAVLILAAAPAFADMTCNEYDRLLGQAATEATAAANCANMTKEGWTTCMTMAVFSGEPKAIALMMLTQDFDSQPAWHACFPDRDLTPPKSR